MHPQSMPDFSGNVDRFTGEAGATGYAAGYDRFRPSPPLILGELLARIAGIPAGGRLGTVVDFGSGTGLSSRYWAARADHVIGIEPTDAMRHQAEDASKSFSNITYRKAFSHDTGLPFQSAQLVSCAQSLHWMHPIGTFREAVRLLRPRGVFAAYDYDWPPATGSWETDAAYLKCAEQVDALAQEHGVAPVPQNWGGEADEESDSGPASLPGQRGGVSIGDISPNTVLHWSKEGHLQRMQRSGAFRHAREVAVHHQDTGNAERLVGLMLSQGSVNSLLKLGFHQEDIGIAQLREVAARCLGSDLHPWVWTCRVRIGIA